MQQQKTETESFNAQVVWTAIRCWWMVAGPIGVMLALGAGYTVYLVTPGNYTAATWLEIRETGDRVLPGGGAGIDESNKFVENQLELIQSPRVVDQVVSLPEVGSTPELAREPNPVVALRRQLRVKRRGKSDFYVIEFTSQVPSRAALIPNEIAKAYLDVQGKEREARFGSVITLLREQLAEKQKAIDKQRGEIGKLTKDSAGKDPYGASKPTAAPNRSVAADLNAQLAQAEVDHEFLKAQVAAEIEAVQKQSLNPPDELVKAGVDNDPALQALIAKGSRLKSQAAELAKVVDTKTSRKYRELRQELDGNTGEIERLRKKLTAEVKGRIAEDGKTRRDRDIAQLQRQVEKAEFALNFLRERKDLELRNQGVFEGDTLRLEFLKSDYERATLVAGLLSDRLYKTELEKKAPNPAEIFEWAQAPRLPDQNLPYKKILMAAAAAFCVPFGCAAAYEAMHQRVNSRKQLETMDIPCTVTEISALPTRSQALIRGRREERLDLFIESVDGLRTSLMLPSSKREVRIFAVTSAIPGEGKTSLATQLALSLASATGEPTLLIDGDLRYPDLHNAFEIDLSPGLAEVFDERCPASDAIVLGRGENLFVLPAGKLTGNPHRLTASGRFRELVGQLRNHFKYIVIDTPPILPASEALVMAKSSDATLLVARRDHSRIDLVREASQRIVNSGSKFAGVVLSGVPSRDYRYRYGAYYYGESRHT